MADNSNIILHWEIDNATATFATGKAESGVFNEGGFKWIAGIENRSPIEKLAFSLQCDSDHTGSWKCVADVGVHVLHSSGGYEYFSQKPFIFGTSSCICVHRTAFDWIDLDNSRFKINGKVTMEFRMTIVTLKRNEPIVDPSMLAAPNRRSDVILKIGDEKLYVSKELLAVHSPVFETLFFGDFAEKGKEEVELKDVVYEEFVEMLHLIYPGVPKITDRIVDHILKLADQFQMEGLLKMANEHLIEYSRLDVANKLLLADQYRLTALRDHCLQSYSTSNDIINQLKSSPEYDYFSADMKAAILDREQCLSELQTKRDFKADKESSIFADLSDVTKALLFVRIVEADLMSSPLRKKMKREDGDERRPPPDAVIQFEVDNISTLDFEGRFSPDIEAKGVLWKANLYKKMVDDKCHVSLAIMYLINQYTPWAIDLNVEYTLINSDNSKSVTFERQLTGNNNRYFWGQRILDWDEFIDGDSGYVKDDVATCRIRLWITKMRGIRNFPRMNFTDPNEPSHDIALVIEGEKVYVSKQYLSVHSPVFKALFYGEFAEKNKDEIELEDVNRKEFLELLQVIYPSSKKIAAESAEYLIKLSDRFQFAVVTDRAEGFLIATVCVNNMEKLRIADQYKLIALKEHCFTHLKTKEDFKAVKESPIYPGLSDATKVLLFERLIETD